MRLVGGFPVVQGFWRSVSMIIGFLGIIGFFAATLMGFVSDWKIILPIIIIFSAMFVSPIYLPKRKQ
ncbi:hypothetical protein J7J13_04515 [bacterium]|nr:hypothetical protein [bacterium]